MKTAQKTLFSLIFLTLFLLLPKSAFASTLHLTPGSGNIGIGQTLAVQVRINTAGGEGVNGVTAVLSYPSDKLDVAYITPGSAFSIEAEKAVGGNTIKISRGNINAINGDVLIATVGFRGKTLGAAKVTFIPGSAAPSASSSNDTLNFGASANANFNVTAAVATSPTPIATGPKISNIQVTNIASNSATIAWKTDTKSDSTVEYGVEKDTFVLSTSKPDRLTDHVVKLDNLTFPPGTKVYFRVKSKDATGTLTTSDTSSFQSKGYKVVVKITDKNGKPLSNIKVTIYSDPNQSVTNDQGEVTFEDMSPGKHVLLIQNGTLEKSQEITIADSSNFANVQDFSLTFDPAASSTPRSTFPLNSKNNIALIILGISFLTLVIIAIFMFLKKRGGGGSKGPSSESNPFPALGSASTTQSNPVVIHPGQ